MMVAAGLRVAHGETKGRTYLTADALKQARDRVVERKVRLVNPYVGGEQSGPEFERWVISGR